LEARRLALGSIAYYLRITDRPGHRVRVAMARDVTLAIAGQRAAELSLRYQKGERDLRGALDAERGGKQGAGPGAIAG
jgi:hypothetical protein